MEKAFEDLINLVKENPELPIICMVDSDVVCDDSYGRWLADLGSCHVGEYALYNERYYDDREEFKEDYYCNNDEILDKYFDYSPIVAYSARQNMYNSMDRETNRAIAARLEGYLDKIADEAFKRAIIVNVNTPSNVDEFMDKEEI